MTSAIKVCCGSAHVQGKASNYRYVIAQLFESAVRKDGVETYRSTGRYVGPFRSDAKAEREGRAWAERLGVRFIPGYGSLHNQPVSKYEPKPKPANIRQDVPADRPVIYLPMVIAQA